MQKPVPDCLVSNLGFRTRLIRAYQQLFSGSMKVLLEKLHKCVEEIADLEEPASAASFTPLAIVANKEQVGECLRLIETACALIRADESQIDTIMPAHGRAVHALGEVINNLFEIPSDPASCPSSSSCSAVRCFRCGTTEHVIRVEGRPGSREFLNRCFDQACKDAAFDRLFSRSMWSAQRQSASSSSTSSPSSSSSSSLSRPPATILSALQKERATRKRADDGEEKEQHVKRVKVVLPPFACAKCEKASEDNLFYRDNRRNESFYYCEDEECRLFARCVAFADLPVS